MTESEYQRAFDSAQRAYDNESPPEREEDEEGDFEEME